MRGACLRTYNPPVNSVVQVFGLAGSSCRVRAEQTSGLLLIGYVVLTRQAVVYAVGQTFPPITAVRLDGQRLTEPRSSCYVIRITADACKYCVLDQPLYAKVLRAAQSAGCYVVALAPQAGQMSAVVGQEASQLKLVSMDLGEALHPFLTPQLIVLDSNRQVAWQRQGTLDDKSVQDGISAIKGVVNR